jgi:type IV pilus assembly protein PilE
MKRGFTLLELIMVIIIIGVLATLGFASYGKLVEGARGAEAREVIGAMRQMAAAFYLRNGGFAAPAITDADLGVGAGGVAKVCAGQTSHFFRYAYVAAGDEVTFSAFRCTDGGKLPWAPAAIPAGPHVSIKTNFKDGSETAWTTVAPY